MALNLRRVIFTDYRNPSFIALTLATSVFALRPDASLTPIVLNLTVLVTYAPFLFRPDERYRLLNVLLTGTALSLGSAASRLGPSLEALSSPAQSVLTLFFISSIFSALTLSALWAGTRFTTRLSSPGSQVTLFPAIWATLWYTISYISPVGHLSTWSVANNSDAYNWAVPYLGPAIKDWIIGAWAVVLSQTITSWYMGPSPDDINEAGNLRENSRTRKIIASLLILLTIPSFYISPLPLPPAEIDIASPLVVGCVIPPYQRLKKHTATLDDYIVESNKLRSLAARIILWPEGAVVFHSAAEKEEAFKKIRSKITGPYVGVAFEEKINDPSDPSGRRGATMTGLAVISQHYEEPHLLYYKRHLVPFAESYRLRHSVTPPTIFEAQLPNPGHGITNPEWAPNGTHTRPVPISASICLDFAHPAPFAELEMRPGLILGPARTWDRTVGQAMWLQAKQRAEELGSTVLWCDGGEGGVSGIAGGGYNDVTQVGAGSFVRTVGVQYPFDSRRTPYARFGDSVLILLWALALGPGVLDVGFLHYLRGWAQSGVSLLRQRKSAPSSVQQNLIDV